MTAREEALARDLAARARLATDPVYRIKQARGGRNVPRIQVNPERGTPSRRELEALRFMSYGLEMSMAAEAMGVGLETVKSLLKSARFRLRAKNTSHACCEAIRKGLIP